MIKWILTTLFFISILTSCREPKDLVFKDFQNLRLEKLGFAGALLKVDLIYYNPNNIGLELNRTDLDVFVDSTLLGHSTQEVQIAVPKRDNFTIPLTIDLDMKNLLKNGIMAMFNKDIKVRLLGKVKVGKAGIYKTFNVDYTTVQNFSFFK
ncbi:MAG: LEA type 2 family protein [Ferruginibacter sp.]